VAVPLQEAGVQVDPVAGDVDRHAELEEEHERRVEGAEAGQQAHSSTPVREHVQDGAEPRALAEEAGRVAVQGVQQTRDSVTPDGGRVVGGHEPEGQQGQEDPSVPDEVGDEQEHVLGLGHVPE